MIPNPDVVIVGGGLTGARAALTLAQRYPHLRLTLVSKVHPIRSHSVAAQGGIAAALGHLDATDNWLDHAFDTVKGSDYLADQNAVAVLTQQAPDTIRELEKLGVLFSRDEEGRIAQRPFGGHSHPRACYAADKTGHAILHELVANLLVQPNVTLLAEWYVLRLIYEDGAVQGVVAYGLETGTVAAIPSKAVLLATGGYGRVFGTTSNDYASTGDGLYLVAREGLPLQDMEFVQFHPTGLYPAGVLISEAVRGEGAYLLNDRGERFMAHYEASRERMELAPRDITSRNIALEVAAGRGIGGGPYVHLDVRHLGREKILQKIPFAREEGLRLAGVDCIEAPLPVRPTAHYSMGGIPTDPDCRVLDRHSRPVPGLYAAGECACLSVHGANRLGANSLLECAVFGQRAGETIGREIGDRPAPAIQTEAYQAQATKAIAHLLNQPGTLRSAALHRQVQEITTAACGIFREETGLRQGSRQLAALQEQYGQIFIDDKGTCFNTELVRAWQLQSVITVARAIAASALWRRESRGAHCRTDYPERNDRDFWQHTLVFFEDFAGGDDPRTAGRAVDLSLQAVDPRRFTPQERKY